MSQYNIRESNHLVAMGQAARHWFCTVLVFMIVMLALQPAVAQVQTTVVSRLLSSCSTCAACIQRGIHRRAVLGAIQLMKMSFWDQSIDANNLPESKSQSNVVDELHSHARTREMPRSHDSFHILFDNIFFPMLVHKHGKEVTLRYYVPST